MLDVKMEATVTRGPESWQFFAFVFAAIASFLLSIVDDLVVLQWLRIILKAAVFLLAFYLYMVNVRIRNRLILFLVWVKTEKH